MLSTFAASLCIRRSISSLSTLPPTIKQVLAHAPRTDTESHQSNDTTTVHGWIKSVRRQKTVSFAVINDGTTLQGLQAVFPHTDSVQSARLKALATGASVRLTGKLIKSPGKGQETELQVKTVEILGECDPETYPMQKKDHSLEFMREHTHLRSRTTNIAAMLRIRDKLVRSFGKWFEDAGFIYTHAPVMTSNDCEGAGEAYRIVADSAHPESHPESHVSSLSTPPTFLTTSTQLHLEALTAALARVYTIAPSFRAERSQTNRHLNEFWMLEAEMSFLSTGIDGVCDVVEDSLKSVLGRLSQDEDVKFLRGPIHEVHFSTWLDRSKPWGRITYSDAISALQAHHASGAEPHFEGGAPKWGDSLRSVHERWIADMLGEAPGSDGTTIGGPVFVTNYPQHLKPFYMWVNDAKREGEEDTTVACFDLLVPKLGELTGGSLRESRLDKLKESMALHGTNKEQHSWYLDLRQYGTTPHGGFGIGFERLVSWFCGIDNVRECIPFPRWAGRIVL